MDFNARQYDPQTGRFLSVDPLAADGGQDRFSPYAAMGDEPAGLVDPGGMYPMPLRTASDNQIFVFGWNRWAHFPRAMIGYVANLIASREDSWKEEQGANGQAEKGFTQKEIDAIGKALGAELIGSPFGVDASFAMNFDSGESGGDGSSSDGDINITGGSDQQQTFSKQEGDVYYKNNPTFSMDKQEFATTCVPSILEYAGQELAGKGTDRLTIMMYASYTFKIDALKNGVNGKFIKPLVEHYFRTKKFKTYRNAINAGHPVFAVMPLRDGGHAVLIIGYNTGTGQMIYMDPMNGSPGRNMPSSFYADYNFPLIRNRN